MAIIFLLSSMDFQLEDLLCQDILLYHSFHLKFITVICVHLLIFIY